jgi:hypothetical protein
MAPVKPSTPGSHPSGAQSADAGKTNHPVAGPSSSGGRSDGPDPTDNQKAEAIRFLIARLSNYALDQAWVGSRPSTWCNFVDGLRA